MAVHDFKYTEFTCNSLDLLATLKEQITGFASYPIKPGSPDAPLTNKWEVHSEELDATSSKIKRLTLKGIVTIGTLSKEMYVRLDNNFFTTAAKHSSMTIQVLDEYNEQDSTWGKQGPPVLCEWADESYTPTDRDQEKPIYGYINVMNNRVALVLVGDPAVNFNDYLKSFVYFGAIKPFQYNQDDVVGNVMVTAGCKTVEKTPAQLSSSGHYFGEYTSVGNNSFQMLKTKSGIVYQKHYPAFITQAPPTGKAFNSTPLGDTGLTLEPQGFQASRWTNKYHMSPIYVVHPYEGYRGQLDNCVAVTRHNILHLDELIVEVTDKPWQQEVYRYFDANAPQRFTNYSANVEMGVAILKEVRYAV